MFSKDVFNYESLFHFYKVYNKLIIKNVIINIKRNILELKFLIY